MATTQEAQAEAQAPNLPKPMMSTLSRQFSKNSGRYKKISQWAVGVALVFIAVSTLASAFHSGSPKFPLAGYHVAYVTAIAAVLFLLASLIRLFRIIRDPERVWFGSRVLAERTRSLGWKYAVAGDPFPRTGMSPDDAIAQYQAQLDKAAVEANDAGIHYLAPENTTGIDVITGWMRETRASSLDQRRAIYAEQRIKDQQTFYTNRMRTYNSRVLQSKWVLYIIEFAGFALAALNAFGILQLDLVGVIGTIAAGIAAWVQFNQYTELSATYGAMAYRMAGYREQCRNDATPWTEERWAMFVKMVEGALDEEHGSWRHVVQQGANDIS